MPDEISAMMGKTNGNTSLIRKKSVSLSYIESNAQPYLTANSKKKSCGIYIKSFVKKPVIIG
jgi:hypothetical protein